MESKTYSIPMFETRPSSDGGPHTGNATQAEDEPILSPRPLSRAAQRRGLVERIDYLAMYARMYERNAADYRAEADRLRVVLSDL